VRAVIACVFVAGCVSPPGASDMDVSTITPAMGPSDRTQNVQIAGLFEPRLVSNLDDGTTTYDGTLSVTIGNTPLLGATRIDSGTITGTVPANLAPDTYDVTVTLGPDTDTLIGAYTVTGIMNPPVTSSIEIDGSTAFEARYQNGFIFTHPIGTGTDRAIVVGLSISFAGTTATAVTCNGAPMTRLVAQDAASSDGRVELWGLAAPASGPASIEVSLVNGTSSTVVAGATSFANVDQAIPFGSPATAGANNGDCAIDVSGGADDVVFGIVNWGGGQYGSLVTSQATAWNRRIDEMADGPSIVGAASIAAGTTRFVWTVAGGPQPPVDFWTAAGISILPN
jgi:hypothetical protein